jgi:D-glycero-alpha-D-manno-heptose-7-phosphate kinase
MADPAGAEFTNRFIVTRTPFRISLAGGGTDLAAFYDSNDYGAVLSFAIDKYVYVTLKEHGQLFDEKIRLNYSEVELLSSLDGMKNDIARGCMQYMGSRKRTYVSTISDLPAASGLGSSSSFAVGFLNALYTARGQKASAGRLAEDACRVEIEILRHPIGRQDAYPSAFGGLNLIKFSSGGYTTVQPVFPPDEKLTTLGRCLLLFYTGIQRDASLVLEGQRRKTERNENSKALLEMRNHAELLATHLRDDADPRVVGEVLNEGWKLKRELSSGISTPRIDAWYSKAMNAGALGGKLCGAGGGGFILLVAEPDAHPRIVDALSDLTAIDIGLENEGSKVLFPNS